MTLQLHHLHTDGPKPLYKKINADEYDRLNSRIAELERMDTEHTLQIAKMNGYIHHLEEELEDEQKWIKIDDQPPPDGETVLFAGFIKYDHENEGDYISDVGSFDYGGKEDPHNGRFWSTWNDWYEGQETYRIDYWRPLPRHPEEK